MSRPRGSLSLNAWRIPVTPFAEAAPVTSQSLPKTATTVTSDGVATDTYAVSSIGSGSLCVVSSGFVRFRCTSKMTRIDLQRGYGS